MGAFDYILPLMTHTELRPYAMGYFVEVGGLVKLFRDFDYSDQETFDLDQAFDRLGDIILFAGASAIAASATEHRFSDELVLLRLDETLHKSYCSPAKPGFVVDDCLKSLSERSAAAFAAESEQPIVTYGTSLGAIPPWLLLIRELKEDEHNILARNREKWANKKPTFF